jgi:hypothetical protein
MMASPDTTFDQRRDGGGVLGFMFRPPPTAFTGLAFLIRLAQHGLVYSGILAIAVLACLFILAPIEVALAGIGAIALAAPLIFVLSAPDVRFRRTVQQAVLASYIASAGALLKAIAALTHWF